LLSGIIVTCTAPYGEIGSQTITAQYLGDSNFKVSPTSTSSTQLVAQAQTTTVVTTDSSTYVSGQTIAITGVVAPVALAAGTPTSTVAVTDGVKGTVCTFALWLTTCRVVEPAGNYTSTG
jgi:hypothetical protein